MSAETWKSLADWATIIFIALTVVSGSAALILGDRINEKQKVEVEELKTKNLALEKALSPRLVGIKSFGDGKTSIDSLKAFAGMEVVLTPIADEEARRAAGSIKYALDGSFGAGWKVTGTMPISTWNTPVRDGVSIQFPHGFQKLPMTEQLRIVGAQQALAKVLLDDGWRDVLAGGEAPDDNFPGLLRIVVGFKPQPVELLK